MKHIETLDWVSLACSADKTRSNPNSVYRDKTSLVATDGHRLHLSNGLPEVTPGYVDGYDGQFPDYQQVMPKTSPSLVLELNCLQIENWLASLKACLAFQKGLAKQKSYPISLRFYTNQPAQLKIDGPSDIIGANLVLRLPLASPLVKQAHPAINFELGYMIDALAGMTGPAMVELKFYGELAPIVISCAERMAVVMPMRA